MASVNITINGVICDLYGRTITGPVKIVGEAMYSDLGVGGGPIFPPQQPPGGGGGGGGPVDPGWGVPEHPADPGYFPPRPAHPIAPGGDPGAHPSHPIALPGDPWWPPDAPQAPQLPPPGSPPVMIPGTQPVNPITPPPAIVVDYPGVGKVLVPQPLPA